MSVVVVLSLFFLELRNHFQEMRSNVASQELDEY